ncbi:putative general secretion pathway protein L [Pseudomonas sp. CFII64]|uniref:PilN domain-containing protein n=1 Tax=Pseudomonas sp. CFII64 TaxID=911242 RepID=UPI0003576B14|nr:PilN domain-containing protein [Pseudomonas sp. CFII64]EPJ79888.1 putative general secretion pathway protein L [Pseudomonas sp. CFII64]
MGFELFWLLQARLKAQWSGKWSGSRVQVFLQAWRLELFNSLPSWLQRSLRPGSAPRHYPWPLPPSMGDEPAGTHVVLDLPADVVLLHRVPLPLAAARDVRSVMAFELDRFTPFDASQVYYAIRRDGIRDTQVWVTLALVQRDFLDQCLHHCTATGLVLEAVEVLDDVGQPMGLDLLPTGYDAAVQHRGRHLAMGLGVACVALAIALHGVWLHNRQIALAVMKTEVQTLRQQANEDAALRNASGASRSAVQFLFERRLNQPSRALLLSELTRCLPPDTWLQTLEISADGQVDVAGLSTRASSLIALIKGCSQLSDPQYQGVIQPDEASGRDRFYIRAKTRGESGDGPPADSS